MGVMRQKSSTLKVAIHIIIILPLSLELFYLWLVDGDFNYLPKPAKVWCSTTNEVPATNPPIEPIPFSSDAMIISKSSIYKENGNVRPHKMIMAFKWAHIDIFRSIIKLFTTEISSCSVIPFPCFPNDPNETDSSINSRSLYWCFNWISWWILQSWPVFM